MQNNNNWSSHVDPVDWQTGEDTTNAHNVGAQNDTHTSFLSTQVSLARRQSNAK